MDSHFINKVLNIFNILPNVKLTQTIKLKIVDNFCQRHSKFNNQEPKTILKIKIIILQFNKIKPDKQLNRAKRSWNFIKNNREGMEIKDPILFLEIN